MGNIFSNKKYQKVHAIDLFLNVKDAVLAKFNSNRYIYGPIEIELNVSLKPSFWGCSQRDYHVELVRRELFNLIRAEGWFPIEINSPITNKTVLEIYLPSVLYIIKN